MSLYRSIVLTSLVAAIETAANGQTTATPPPGPIHNPRMDLFAHTVDVDGDGKITHAEWAAQRLPEAGFRIISGGKGYVTLHDLDTIQAPDGIDINGDGVLTVEEFREFARRTEAAHAKNK